MTSPALPPDLESVSVCVPDHYGRLAGKRIAAHRFGQILAGGLDMPDFHLVTGPDNQPAAGVAATGDHTGFPNDVLWPDMETFRRLPWDPDTGIVLAQARRRDGSVIAEAPRAIHRSERCPAIMVDNAIEKYADAAVAHIRLAVKCRALCR